MFASAKNLFEVAPWRGATGGQVLRVDIPNFDINSGCVSVIGSLRESFGCIIFPSIDRFKAFQAIAASHQGHPRPSDIGTSMLSLTFDRGADLPERMRREVIENRWPVAGPDAYPVVQHHDEDGGLRPLTDRDSQVVSACGAGLSELFEKHGSLLNAGSSIPTTETCFVDGGIEVRLTVPYNAGR